MNRIQQDNPATVKVILIGSSSEKRPLYVLKVPPMIKMPHKLFVSADS